MIKLPQSSSGRQCHPQEAEALRMLLQTFADLRRRVTAGSVTIGADAAMIVRGSVTLKVSLRALLCAEPPGSDHPRAPISVGMPWRVACCSMVFGCISQRLMPPSLLRLSSKKFVLHIPPTVCSTAIAAKHR